MSGDGWFSIIILLIYAIFFFIMALIALIPSVIQAIGIARICNKIGAFKPVWSWVWAFLFPPVAILRAGDVAAARENPRRKKMLVHGLIATAVFMVFTILTVLCMIAYSAVSEMALGETWETIMIIMVFVMFVPTMLVAIWMAVPTYISLFRIFKLYVPTWGAWLILAGMILLSDLSFLVLPVLSFIPIKKIEPEQAYEPEYT